ncbi:carbohydrate ABC transporter permease [Pseudonocardia sp. MH-G8]|uniref:carbohydrate ABC transporter permease n=1 Tax=Pseudonocardia sp. MH-G8 TaxID=1854588 RepID=UPI000BA0D68C|nr:sugar ABC transporter permease [Pseudonocardia sp. MH-G8]OZM75801.1 ABC transporter permease [Pseudonocardia sp. MH-G8]
MTATLPVRRTADPRRRPLAPRRRPLRVRATPYLFLGPAALLFLGLIAVPIGYAVVLSLFGPRVSGGAYGVRRQVFLGLENYARSLTDSVLLESIGRMFLFALIMVPLMMGSALLFALLLDAPRTRLKGPARTAIFLPYAVPGVIASLMWGFLYLPSTSPAVDLGRLVGVELPDLLNGPIVYGSIANIVIWSGVGFNMIILYTSLRSIPEETIDAARIDGANERQIAWYIKVPSVLPALTLTGLFCILGALQTYSEPTTLSSLTTGISSTFFPLMKVYQDAFANDDLNHAAATSVLLAVGTLLLSLLILKLFATRANGSQDG